MQLPGNQKMWIRFSREEYLLLRSFIIPLRCYFGDTNSILSEEHDERKIRHNNVERKYIAKYLSKSTCLVLFLTKSAHFRKPYTENKKGIIRNQRGFRETYGTKNWFRQLYETQKRFIYLQRVLHPFEGFLANF